MAKTKIVGVRLNQAELEKLNQLSKATGQNPSEAVRALIRSAVAIVPEQPAMAVFEHAVPALVEG